ncbi:transcriptional regulator, TetR family [Actinopolyspora alba]|uniref:Transcriptional regulator, TetR family n=1 Tax=Actinopolyspora alba TaxID=673379 RepID=A0A1I1V842_9ACTN|nr:TetR family transcriptional regulator [Actinopolyspora alba]SFD79064.1 transcriptional regulator, TetR family [Actinopolyspora alba]
MRSNSHDNEETRLRRGRRGGDRSTRGELLDAARAAFIENGYEGATVRGIASRAGVDPAMVRHWFGGKEGLFTAAVAIPIEPGKALPLLLDGPDEQLAERMLGMFLSVWDEAGGGEFTALIRSLSVRDSAVRMLREFLSTALFDRLLRELRSDEPELRATLCGSQVVGLGMMRYVLRMEPLASADHETVVATIAPNLQRYLTGSLRPDRSRTL